VSSPGPVTPHTPDGVFDDLVPAFLVVGLPPEARGAANALGVQPAAFRPVRGGALQADFEVPAASSWRLWPDRGVAVWFGRDRGTAVPPVRWGWRAPDMGLHDCLRRLAAHGIWLQEGRLLRADATWTPTAPAAAVLASLEGVCAVSGTFSDAEARAVRGVVFDDGRLWTETYADAEQWLLAMADLLG
jgi:hypothetical protein